MSIMHQALSRTDQDRTQPSGNYNPLATQPKRRSRSGLLWLASLGMVAIAVAIVLWPTASDLPDSAPIAV